MDNLLAKKMFNSISGLTKYSISIINENGRVLASTVKEHIGVFHETAFELLKSDKDIKTVNINDPESGIKEGVYMTLLLNSRKTGVICVYGNPPEVLPVIRVMKHSLETMLEFELYKQNNMRRYSAKERVLKIIFNDEFEYSDLEQAVRDASLDKNATLIPVLLEIKEPMKHASPICKLLENGNLSSKNDLVGLTNEGCIFLFKSIQGNIDTIMEDYKYVLGEYLSSALQYARTNNLKYSLYVGPIQSDIMCYRQSFLYCRWMQNHICKQGSFYFYDYIMRYFSSIMSLDEYNTVFSYLKRQLKPKFIEGYMEIMEALIEKDYNLSQASSMLHIHKNTLAYHLNKIREILNMNPLNSSKERVFMECFYYYLAHDRSK